jgi:hypothetical protein
MTEEEFLRNTRTDHATLYHLKAILGKDAPFPITQFPAGIITIIINYFCDLSPNFPKSIKRNNHFSTSTCGACEKLGLLKGRVTVTWESAVQPLQRNNNYIRIQYQFGGLEFIEQQLGSLLPQGLTNHKCTTPNCSHCLYNTERNLVHIYDLPQFYKYMSAKEVKNMLCPFYSDVSAIMEYMEEFFSTDPSYPEVVRKKWLTIVDAHYPLRNTSICQKCNKQKNKCRVCGLRPGEIYDQIDVDQPLILCNAAYWYTNYGCCDYFLCGKEIPKKDASNICNC